MGKGRRLIVQRAISSVRSLRSLWDWSFLTASTFKTRSYGFTIFTGLLFSKNSKVVLSWRRDVQSCWLFSGEGLGRYCVVGGLLLSLLLSDENACLNALGKALVANRCTMKIMAQRVYREVCVTHMAKTETRVAKLIILLSLAQPPVIPSPIFRTQRSPKHHICSRSRNELEPAGSGRFGSVARDPWSPLIHGWLRSLVDPVTCLVEENQRLG